MGSNPVGQVSYFSRKQKSHQHSTESVSIICFLFLKFPNADALFSSIFVLASSIHSFEEENKILHMHTPKERTSKRKRSQESSPTQSAVHAWLGISKSTETKTGRQFSQALARKSFFVLHPPESFFVLSVPESVWERNPR
jgi:hypothetical protein